MADFRRRRVILFLMMLLDEEERKTINRTQWQRKWLQRREVLGTYHSIFMELAVEDMLKFFEFIRMSYPKFLELVNLIGPSITRENTHLRSTIPPGERLALTLRCLVMGESFSSLPFQFRIGESTIGEIVMEVCTAIVNVMQQDFLKTPNRKETWKEIADGFSTKWNIPNNIGAIDGKRIVIRKPLHSGSYYHDYKGNDSIIALVVAGPEYECLYVNVGINGRNSDGHAWGNCSLKDALDVPTNPLNIPSPQPLPNRTTPVNFVLTGDEAFGLAKYMLRPYPQRNLTLEQRIANYRISRGRRISENILGILCNRWRCFRTPFLLCPEKVKVITITTLILHNCLRADKCSRNIIILSPCVNGSRKS